MWDDHLGPDAAIPRFRLWALGVCTGVFQPAWACSAGRPDRMEGCQTLSHELSTSSRQDSWNNISQPE
eukprot:scaffold15739_cov92-Phaeocystis_antarctica.AAC.1